jgi:hypothetical protein
MDSRCLVKRIPRRHYHQKVHVAIRVGVAICVGAKQINLLGVELLNDALDDAADFGARNQPFPRLDFPPRILEQFRSHVAMTPGRKRRFVD